ncbi:hypothetical protein Thiowin_02775 [Thiorhodovibrio winogradskyi]|uniref:Uncharacterized protein n=1 Tax=Thiorhodovibrio winogradskyi TaxID=77007 RepID=A0ABZ0S9M6_9GAMM
MRFSLPSMKKSADPEYLSRRSSESVRPPSTFREQVISNVSKCLRESNRTGPAIQGISR